MPAYKMFIHPSNTHGDGVTDHVLHMTNTTWVWTGFGGGYHGKPSRLQTKPYKQDMRQLHKRFHYISIGSPSINNDKQTSKPHWHNHNIHCDNWFSKINDDYTILYNIRIVITTINFITITTTISIIQCAWIFIGIHSLSYDNGFVLSHPRADLSNSRCSSQICSAGLHALHVAQLPKALERLTMLGCKPNSCEKNGENRWERPLLLRDVLLAAVWC